MTGCYCCRRNQHSLLQCHLKRCRRPSGRPWPGHVLGRFINDTWPAPAGPGHFIGLFSRVFSGRVLGLRSETNFMLVMIINYVQDYLQTRGVSRGCSGCSCTPRAEKKFRRNLQGKFVSTPPPSTPSAPSGTASQFCRRFLAGRGDLEVGVVHLVVFDRLLMATTKKKSTFLEKSALLREKKS